MQSSKFQIGDKVIVIWNDKGHPWGPGIITGIDKNKNYPYRVFWETQTFGMAFDELILYKNALDKLEDIL